MTETIEVAGMADWMPLHAKHEYKKKSAILERLNLFKTRQLMN